MNQSHRKHPFLKLSLRTDAALESAMESACGFNRLDMICRLFLTRCCTSCSRVSFSCKESRSALSFISRLATTAERNSICSTTEKRQIHQAIEQIPGGPLARDGIDHAKTAKLTTLTRAQRHAHAKPHRRLAENHGIILKSLVVPCVANHHGPLLKQAVCAKRTFQSRLVRLPAIFCSKPSTVRPHQRNEGHRRLEETSC